MDYTLEDGREFFQKTYLQLKLLFIPSEMNEFRPKFLESKILLCFVVFLLFLKIASVVVFINFPRNIFFADITRAALTNLVNQERADLGLQTLTENQQLNEAAALKARDIMDKDYFAHETPDGKSPWYWFTKIGYNYKYAGENLAIGFLNSEDVYTAWFNSISHRDNMISPYYNEIGTAVLTGDFKGSEATVVVQLFGTQKNVKAPIAKEVEKPIEKPIEKEQTPPVKDQPLAKINSGEVLSQSTRAPMSQASILYYKFLNFAVYNSESIFKYITYLCLVLIASSLLLNILINFSIQDRGLILRSLLLIVLLSAVLLIDKNLVQVIPHKITI